MTIDNSYTTVCPPVRVDNPRALASGRLSPVQENKQWYNYFIPPTSVQALFSTKYFVLKFALSSKVGKITTVTCLLSESRNYCLDVLRTSG